MHYKKNIIYEINQIQTLGKKSYRTFSAVFVATSPGRETMRTVGFKNSIFWHMTYDDHIKLLFILQLNFHKVPLEFSQGPFRTTDSNFFVWYNIIFSKIYNYLVLCDSFVSS